MPPSGWMSEIRLWAITQIGKISRELDKAKFEHDRQGKLHRIPTTGKTATKEQQLADAGLAAPEEQLTPASRSSRATGRPLEGFYRRVSSKT